MKTLTKWRGRLTRLCLTITAVAVAASARTASAQYSVSWHKVSGGGGTSTSATYTVSGTIGQHDASQTLNGAAYAVTGGFWAIYALPTIGNGPPLNIKLTTTNTALVYWAYPSVGWRLEANTDLKTTTWVTPPETIQNNGVINYIIVNPVTGNRYFKLTSP